jgi:hypothetical protein
MIFLSVLVFLRNFAAELKDRINIINKDSKDEKDFCYRRPAGGNAHSQCTE